jgi:hypothetical protein
MQKSKVVVALALLFSVVILAHSAAHAICTPATLKGAYGFINAGFSNDANSTAFSPDSNVGLVVYDGAGHWATAWTNVSNGSVTPGITDSGTYIINPDCTGSVVNVSGDIQMNFVVVNSGQEILAIETDSSGRTNTFDFKKR